jgi:hypothetical protein
MKEKDAPPSTPPTAVTPPPTEPADVPGHTEAQGLLADIGKKLGCSIWIAQNDRNKLYQGRPLGNLSLPALPALGMESEAEKTVSRIDVLWLRGKNQIVAAFEIEQTTSIYSGLLRMSDLVSSAPNTHFPLYIVAPRKRQGEVRGELARPTFKYLELYKRCGFIPNEELAAKGQHIISWANDPSAINKLAARFDDIEAEE